MSIITILVVIASMCAAIYLTAIYALPILAGLAAYSLLNQIDASTPTIAIVSITSGFAAFAAARAGAAARNDAIRLATLALIAAPAGYAGFAVSGEIAAFAGVGDAARIVLGLSGGATLASVSVLRVSPARLRALIN